MDGIGQDAVVRGQVQLKNSGPRNSDGNPDFPQVVVFLATIIDVIVGS